MDKKQIIESLSHDFINKDRRERCRFELASSKKRVNFINRLNHEITELFSDRKIQKITTHIKSINDLKIASPIKEDTFCYIISNNEKVDDDILTFEKAINEVFGFGLGSVIYDYENGKVYLEGEQDFSAPERFFGKS